MILWTLIVKADKVHEITKNIKNKNKNKIVQGFDLRFIGYIKN